ncbi:trypsin-like serine protease [Planctomycetales bacterium ZRK34]|nr:trypsin-like serine protease [Planctomycetales bacterium ZRK34]
MAIMALCVLSAGSAFAGTIRDDRSDQLYLDLAGASSAYASVGQFIGTGTDSGGSYGFAASGVLIANNWVLTAGHVSESTTTSLTFKIGGQNFASDQYFAHSNWDGNLGKGYDIGLVHFSDDLVLQTGLAAAELYTGKNEVGEIATAVGFGTTGTGLTGWQSGSLVKRAGNNVIDASYNTPGKNDRILLTDFDNPHTTADNNFGSATPLDLEYMTAPGDSGGGLFINVDGIDLLAGITSFGWGRLDGVADSDYGDVGGYTRVSQFIDWINSYTGLGDGGGGKGGGKGGSGGGGGGNGKGGGKPTLLITAVPEPSTMGLLGVGMIMIVRRRRKA